MMTLEESVAKHYGKHDVLNNILGALKRAGFDRSALNPEDLSPVDEFHTGGVLATEALLSQIHIPPNARVLDIGSGIGGTARHVAKNFGARVVGVDLTEAYVETAQFLSSAVDLNELTKFHAGNATDLPVMDQTFDLALMFHVGMNIEDKAALFRSVSRALTPNGTFAIFDVMREDETMDVMFPVPWAERDQTSFVASPAAYRDLAQAAGFRLLSERDRRDFALNYFRSVIEGLEADGPPALGIHLLMGETAAEKIQNYVANLRAGSLAPREMIFRKL
ncbi:MAG: class I SAM-dependent methyltransferase [Pseudomonadota bacterium]